MSTVVPVSRAAGAGGCSVPPSAVASRHGRHRHGGSSASAARRHRWKPALRRGTPGSPPARDRRGWRSCWSACRVSASASSSSAMPVPLSVTLMRLTPPSSSSTRISVAPASRLFSRISFRAAGQAPRSPRRRRSADQHVGQHADHRHAPSPRRAAMARPSRSSAPASSVARASGSRCAFSNSRWLRLEATKRRVSAASRSSSRSTRRNAFELHAQHPPKSGLLVVLQGARPCPQAPPARLEQGKVRPRRRDDARRRCRNRPGLRAACCACRPRRPCGQMRQQLVERVALACDARMAGLSMSSSASDPGAALPQEIMVTRLRVSRAGAVSGCRSKWSRMPSTIASTSLSW